MESAQFCGQCGGRMAATEKFCIACGTPRRAEEGTATSAPTVPLNLRDEQPTTKNIAPPNTPTPTEPTAVSPETLSGPNGLLTNGVVYVVAYLIVAIPTYVLPYFGSNSSVINALGAATGLGALPQFWFHLIALYLLVVIAWIRGGRTGRQWLAIFPVFAGIFDMVPGFSVIPMLPTIFHVLAVIIGVSGKLVAVEAPGAGKRRLVLSGVGFAGIAILAVVKTQAFLQHIEESPLRSNNTSAPSSRDTSQPSPRRPEANRSAATSVRDFSSLTIDNENCWPQDFYVDGAVVATIPAKASRVIQVRSGRHVTRACTSKSSDCGNETPVTWTPGSQRHTLYRHPQCTW